MGRLEMGLWAADFIITGIGWALGGGTAAMFCFLVGGILVFLVVFREDKNPQNPSRLKRWHRYGLATFTFLVIVLLGAMVVRHTTKQEISATPPQAPAQTPPGQAQGAPVIQQPILPPSVKSHPSVKPRGRSLSETALALAANIRKLSQEWQMEQTKIDNATGVTDQQRKSMRDAWAVKVMAEYDSKYKADARITHEQLIAQLPTGTDALAMKDNYENEVNPGLLEIIASNLEHLAKMLRGQSQETTAKSSQPQVGGISQGAGSALSINQQGGITAGTIIGTPPCQWNLLTDQDFIKIAQIVSLSRAKIYIGIPPSNNDAARFAGYLQPALKTISHWDTDDFETAEGSFWVKYPGITVIARDESEFSDPTKPASKLKNAIQSVGITVHTKPVASLRKGDDLGLFVNTCE